MTPITTKKTGFTNQKPRIATEEDVKAPWSGGPPGKYFRCTLCGHRFQVGNYWRWVYMGKHALTNILACEACDTADVDEKWIKANEEWKQMEETGPFWWFISQIERLEEELRNPYLDPNP